MRTRNEIKAAVLLIVVAAFFFASSCARQPSKFNPKTMNTYEVTRGDLSEVISISGNLKEGDERKLSFPATVSGRIVEVDVEEGQKVGAGEVLVRVDDAKQQLSLDQAEAALSQAQSSVNTARINYQAALDSNHTTVQITASNYELSKKQVSAARNQLSAAQDSLYYTKKQLIEAQNYYNEVLRYNNSQTWDTEAEKHAAELNEINARASLAASEKSYIAALDAITSAQDSLAQAKKSRDASYYSMIEQQQSSEAQIKLTSIAIDSALAATAQQRHLLSLLGYRYLIPP
ncbi:MAG: biotin/lipoyl-binding protein [Actinobacteria bacterium]|nr:biotin/lipoyl-binding protein [Actinomycetota bacterium]